MCTLEDIRKYFKLKRTLEEVLKDGDIAHKVASVVIFNGDTGVFELGEKYYEVTPDGVKEFAGQPDGYYEPDGSGFFIIEDGEVVGFTMPQEEVVVKDFSVSSYGLALTFRYEVVRGKPLLHFADGRPSLIGKLIFYKTGGEWRLGRVEGFTVLDNENTLVAGVPLVAGKPVLAQFIPVTHFGYPDDEFVIVSLLKNDLKRLVNEYSTRENIESLAKAEALTISVIDRLLTYRDELLLWDIASDVIRNATKKLLSCEYNIPIGGSNGR